MAQRDKKKAQAKGTPPQRQTLATQSKSSLYRQSQDLKQAVNIGTIIGSNQ
jgi:hypothetical protein